MALPKIDIPIFDLNLPSTGEAIKYRPFLVKEEKILLMALEGKDPIETARAIKTLVENCCESPVDVDKFSPADLEYFFLNLRAKSISETINLEFVCQGKDQSCGEKIPFEIELDKVEVVNDENHSTKIQLTKNVGVIMKYPSLEDISKSQLSEDPIKGNMDLLMSSIDKIYDDESVHKVKDISPEDLTEWVEHLSPDNFIKIRDFLTTMPKVVYKKTLKCKKCKHKNEIEIEGAQNFFQ